MSFHHRRGRAVVGRDGRVDAVVSYQGQATGVLGAVDRRTGVPGAVGQATGVPGAVDRRRACRVRWDRVRVRRVRSVVIVRSVTRVLRGMRERGVEFDVESQGFGGGEGVAGSGQQVVEGQPQQVHLYLSAAADFDISQAVDQVWGVHGEMRVADFAGHAATELAKRVLERA